MGGLALLQKVSVDSSWLDYLILAIFYFLFVLGIGAIPRRRIRSSGDYFLSGRSLQG